MWGAGWPITKYTNHTVARTLAKLDSQSLHDPDRLTVNCLKAQLCRRMVVSEPAISACVSRVG